MEQSASAWYPPNKAHPPVLAGQQTPGAPSLGRTPVAIPASPSPGDASETVAPHPTSAKSPTQARRNIMRPREHSPRHPAQSPPPRIPPQITSRARARCATARHDCRVNCASIRKSHRKRALAPRHQRASPSPMRSPSPKALRRPPTGLPLSARPATRVPAKPRIEIAVRLGDRGSGLVPSITNRKRPGTSRQRTRTSD